MKRFDYYSETFAGERSHMQRQLEHRELQAFAIFKKLGLEKGSSVLDLGCGDGRFLAHLRDSFGADSRYQGGEYSKYQRDIANSREGLRVEAVDLEEGLPFDDGVFDYIYSGEVVEHLYNPDRMVEEVYRVAKDGAHCILTTPNLNSWISRLFFLFGYQPLNYECSTRSSSIGYGLLKKFKKQDNPVGHVRLYNVISIREFLEAYGFDIISISGTVFERFNGPLRLIDKGFACIPSLASGLVVHCRKR